MSEPKSIEERRAEIQARRAARAAEMQAAYDEQEVADLEALEDAEIKLGSGRVVVQSLKRAWKPGDGAATMIIARVPTKRESLYKRFQDRVARAKEGSGDGVAAGIELATACIVYPEPKSEALAATLELAPGILAGISADIVKRAMGETEEEKKD